MSTGLTLKMLPRGAMILFAGSLVHTTRDGKAKARRITVYCAILLVYALGAFLD